jgi:hypothetical protein
MHNYQLLREVALEYGYCDADMAEADQMASADGSNVAEMLNTLGSRRLLLAGGDVVVIRNEQGDGFTLRWPDDSQEHKSPDEVYTLVALSLLDSGWSIDD